MGNISALRDNRNNLLLYSLWIFPEGTRHHGGEMLPFKKGAFHVALNCGLPILPVIISEYDFLDHKKKSFENGKIRYFFQIFSFSYSQQ